MIDKGDGTRGSVAKRKRWSPGSRRTIMGEENWIIG
jgi:hypothetical protein